MVEKRLFLRIFTIECARNYFKFIVLFNILFVSSLFSMDCTSKFGPDDIRRPLDVEKCYVREEIKKFVVQVLNNVECAAEQEKRQGFLHALYLKKYGSIDGENKECRNKALVGENCGEPVFVPEGSEKPLDMKNFEEASFINDQKLELYKKDLENGRKRLLKLREIVGKRLLEKEEIKNIVWKIFSSVAHACRQVMIDEELRLIEAKRQLLTEISTMLNRAIGLHTIEEDVVIVVNNILNGFKKVRELNKTQIDIAKKILEMLKAIVENYECLYT